MQIITENVPFLLIYYFNFESSESARAKPLTSDLIHKN